MLLERSILKTGWIQPVLVSRDKVIIDGFHRWSLTRDSVALRERYGGKLPCAVLDVSVAEAMLLTVRINRAKGTHIAVGMSALVKRLIDEHHYDPDEIAVEIGGTRAEVDLLYQDSIFREHKLDEWRYSPAWRPADTRFEPKDRISPDGHS